jgi:CRISPR-associated protein Csb2
MLTLEFSFLTGRYHGTPWGRHVNEAAVDWPPDTWRLCRALTAIWYRKVDASEYPLQCLTGLLARLTAESPHYRLPEAVHFHTRHYMPGKGNDKPLVFDAFAQVGREAALLMHWPELDLPDEERDLLGILLERISYLGRAESWAESRVVPGIEGEYNCRPLLAAEPDPGMERITLWQPQRPDEYAVFRNQALQDMEHRALKPQERKRLLKTLPESWHTALSLDTGELQAAGWSAPPAARQHAYQRPVGILSATAKRTATRRRPRLATPPTTARFALYGNPLPRITEAVRVGELARLAAMGCARRLMGERLPASLSGHGNLPGTNHRHAFYLPEDANGDGRIDHLLIHASGGFEPEACRTLAQLQKIWSRDGTEWTLLLEGLGGVTDIASTCSGLLSRDTRWVSVTPYLHPWYIRRDYGLLDQLRKECAQRGLPRPLSIESMPDVRPRALEFRRHRSRQGLEQPDRRGCFLGIKFEEPVTGPLALGFGCHFGLGLFTAEDH